MYAIITTGGKQYKVAEGDVIYVEKLDIADGEPVEFPEVVAVNKGSSLKVGNPYVKGAKVSGKVVKSGRQKKITVFTYRSKKNSKRKMGHRQAYTKVQIESIEA